MATIDELWDRISDAAMSPYMAYQTVDPDDFVIPARILREVLSTPVDFDNDGVIETILIDIDNALRNGANMTKANIAFDKLCERLGRQRPEPEDRDPRATELRELVESLWLDWTDKVLPMKPVVDAGRDEKFIRRTIDLFTIARAVYFEADNESYDNIAQRAYDLIIVMVKAAFNVTTEEIAEGLKRMRDERNAKRTPQDEAGQFAVEWDDEHQMRSGFIGSEEGDFASRNAARAAAEEHAGRSLTWDDSDPNLGEDTEMAHADTTIYYVVKRA